jgi:hypothetical protein
MNRRLTARVAGAATVLALAGGGVAYAAGTGTTTTPNAPTQTELQAPPSGGMPGRPPGDRGHRGFGFGHGLGFGARGDLARTAAGYLGLSERALGEQLRAGRSLADVARAQGKSVEGLQEAIVAAATTRLNRAVDDGWLGARARDQILKELRDRVSELVSATPPAGRPPRDWRGDRDGSGRKGRDCAPPAGRSGRSDKGSGASSGSEDSAGA